MDEKQDIYRFQLSFKGDLVENSVDAFDIATTILATSQALNQIATIAYGDGAKNISININAFKQGSLVSDFIIFLKDTPEAAGALLAPVTRIWDIGKSVLSYLKDVIDVKQFLKGQQPEKVEPLSDNTVNVYGDNNTVININTMGFRSLQDPMISKCIEKAVSPLTKEASELSELEIIGDGNERMVAVQKNDAHYLVSPEQTQIVDMINKGEVTKLDTKARSGFLSIGSRRISFYYSESLEKEKFDILASSLKDKLKIYLIGEVEMGYENNPRKINVTDVRQDENFFGGSPDKGPCGPKT